LNRDVNILSAGAVEVKLLCASQIRFYAHRHDPKSTRFDFYCLA